MSTVVKVLFFLADLCFLTLAIYFSYSERSDSEQINFVYLLIYSSLAWLFLVLVSNPYAVTKNWKLSKILKSQFVFLFMHLLVVASLILFFHRSYTSVQIAKIYLIFIPTFFSWKLLIFYIRKIKTKEVVRKYLLVGKNDVADNLRKHYLLNPSEGFRFVGQLGNSDSAALVTQVREFCEGQEVHQIFFCATEVNQQRLTDLVNFGLDSMIQVKIVVENEIDINRKLTLADTDYQSTIEINTIPLDETRNQTLKRVFDVLFSLIFSSLVLSWLIPLIALIIKVESRGSVFFIQQRNGQKNKPFGCIKFRTMVVNQEADLKQATKDDNRITKVGRFLRKSSIDELPQFVNVLLGDMSLIGPRPHPIKLNEKFSTQITNLMARHYVKPGITGLAQCMGYRGETVNLQDMENRVRLDRYYIENWTFWLDIKIIFLTIVSLLRGSEKAY